MSNIDNDVIHISTLKRLVVSDIPDKYMYKHDISMDTPQIMHHVFVVEYSGAYHEIRVARAVMEWFEEKGIKVSFLHTFSMTIPGYIKTNPRSGYFCFYMYANHQDSDFVDKIPMSSYSKYGYG